MKVVCSLVAIAILVPSAVAAAEPWHQPKVIPCITIVEEVALVEEAALLLLAVRLVIILCEIVIEELGHLPNWNINLVFFKR